MDIFVGEGLNNTDDLHNCPVFTAVVVYWAMYEARVNKQNADWTTNIHLDNAILLQIGARNRIRALKSMCNSTHQAAWSD